MVVPLAPPAKVIESLLTDPSLFLSYCTALLARAPTLLFMLLIALSSCPLFTASVEETPAATLLIVLLPALIPEVVILGPPAMIRPVVPN